MEHELRAADRYCALQERARRILDRMHPGLAVRTDLDGLDRLLGTLERVLLHGDRVRIGHAQASRAVESSPPAPAAGAEAEGEAEAAGAGGQISGCPPKIDPEALRAWSQADPFNQMAEEGGAAPGEEAPKGGAEAAPLEPPGGPDLIVSQRPPVAKPGRTRGWVPGKVRPKPPAKPKRKRQAKAKPAVPA